MRKGYTQARIPSRRKATRGSMRIDVPTLLYVVYIALFIGLFVVAGLVFGFRWITFAFMGFTALVILMIDFTSRLIQEPEAK